MGGWRGEGRAPRVGGGAHLVCHVGDPGEHPQTPAGFGNENNGCKHTANRQVTDLVDGALIHLEILKGQFYSHFT